MATRHHIPAMERTAGQAASAAALMLSTFLDTIFDATLGGLLLLSAPRGPAGRFFAWALRGSTDKPVEPNERPPRNTG